MMPANGTRRKKFGSRAVAIRENAETCDETREPNCWSKRIRTLNVPAETREGRERLSMRVKKNAAGEA